MSDYSYYHRRAAQERAMAEQAASETAAAKHLEMAQRCDELAGDKPEKVFGISTGHERPRGTAPVCHCG